MDISIFLAKALGIYLVIISLSMFINSERYKSIIHDVTYNPSFLFLTGVIALIIGILMVISHNIWQANWRTIITLIAWLSFIKGTVRVLFPQLAYPGIQRLIKNSIVYNTTAFICLLLGILLSYFGFF
jgi:hypothetical protein